ncbi:MAG: hypothetical protein IJP61_03360 [Treponema sp.]|nr:hypothetical protein [Treponema sp.]
MKRYSLILLLALMFFSCKETKQNQKNPAPEATEKQEVATEKNVQPKEPEHLAYDILKKMTLLPDDSLGKDAFEKIVWENKDGSLKDSEHLNYDDMDNEGNEILVFSLNCFPYKDGGYAVLFQTFYGCKQNIREETFTYKNGVLSRCERDVFIPEPPADFKNAKLFYSVYGNYLEFTSGIYNVKITPEVHYIWNGEKFVGE